MSDLRLVPIPALSDNYIWLLADPAGNALVVDPGDATPVLDVLARDRLRLRAILLTHHHPDHIAGVAGLLREFPSIAIHAPEEPRIPFATHRVADGAFVDVQNPSCRFTVIAVPGHTSSHIAYHGENILFCGDTLFSIGCGRMFEGTPAQMLGSLDRLMALPHDTRVCCGHEYTLANCAFARTIEPGNVALRERQAAAQTQRAAGRPSLPSSLGDEIACNPFLRTDARDIIAHLASALPANAGRIERFAALRRLKDDFRV